MLDAQFCQFQMKTCPFLFYFISNFFSLGGPFSVTTDFQGGPEESIYKIKDYVQFKNTKKLKLGTTKLEQTKMAGIVNNTE